MEYTQLPGTDLQPSVLGFGCAPIMGRVGRRTALRALEKAYDYGINYFDVARSYGYGQAEAVLGEFLQGRREEVLVATKVGMEPPPAPRRGLLRTTLPLARKVMSWLPHQGRKVLKRSVARSGVSEAKGGRFEVSQVRQSLEKSLRNLKTDYVDVLLLHDCSPADVDDPELLTFLEKSVRTGKIRYYGAATGVEACNQILTQHSAFQVAQFAHHLCDLGKERLTSGCSVATITHSPFGQNINLIERLADCTVEHPDAVEKWTAQTGLNMQRRSNIARVLLSHVLHQNQQGVVLSSMFDENHIAANVGTARRPVPQEVSDPVVRSMRELLSSECRVRET